MKTFLLMVIFTVNGETEIETVSEHKTLLTCHVTKAQYSTNGNIKYQCIKKDNKA